MHAADPLARLVRSDWDAASRAEVSSGAPIDWTDVVERALRHGVGGLLCRAAGALPANVVPPDIAAAARVYLDDAEARGQALIADLEAVLDTLAAAHVPALAFKGPALAALAHGSATIRPSRDLDVLVHLQDMPRAVEALGRLGYRQTDILSPRAMAACYESYGQDILFAEGRATVEPHCAFVPSTLAVDLELDGLWQRALSSRVGNVVVPTLSVEDTLLVACLHGGKERWWRLLWIADVAALLHRHPALDWAAVDDRARSAGVRRMLMLGVGLARDLFGTKLPDDIAGAIARDRVLRRVLEEVKHDLSRPGGQAGPPERLTMYSLRLRERPRDRMRHVVRSLTTPGVRHYRMLRLPDALFGGYVVVKMAHDYAMLPLWRLVKGRARRRSAA